MRKIICDLCHKEIKTKEGEKVIRINYGLTVPIGGRYRLVLMSILVVCCVWNIMEVAIK